MSRMNIRGQGPAAAGTSEAPASAPAGTPHGEGGATTGATTGAAPGAASAPANGPGPAPFDGVSIVVPTENRANLLEAYLASLAEERARFAGPSEVVVVDSSEGTQKEAIQASCARHDARYFEGPQSVRKKRNMGVEQTRYQLLLFLDSDVVVEPGTIQAHVDAYRGRDFVGAAQGLTVFVGEGGLCWKVAELSNLTGSFQNAAKYPFQSWSITNNLSVRKDVFYQIGRFCEDFPFKLGGDDLEMSYRIAHAGYMIASAPQAVALHSKETWDKPAALLDRTRRWGTMESLVCGLHPELYKRVIPKNHVFWLPLLLLLLAAALVAGAAGMAHAAAPAWAALFLLALLAVGRYAKDCRARGKLLNPLHLLLACAVNARYEFFRLKGFAKAGRRTAFTYAMVFNFHQVRGSYGPDAARLRWLLACFCATAVFLGVVAHVC